MNKNTRIILLSIISVLIIIVIVLGVTSAFMRPVVEESSITSVNLESCAHITLTDTGESINLSNSYPMTKNRALETTPYTFSVSSSCEGDTGFNLYLATLNTNTLPDSSIHYIITEHDNKTILEEGILSDVQNSVSDFLDYEIEQLNNGIGGTYGNIYKIFNGPVSSTATSYDLYLYIDESVTNETMGKTFSAGVAVKAGEYEPTLAEYIINQYTGVDGENGLYYHDTDLENGAADNSYRYAGANPNNYVCFGDDCSNEDNLYRIIGVFGSEVKLIKATSYGNYAWDSGGSNTWDSSTKPDIRSTLNTTYLNTLDQEWQAKIATHAFKVGGGSSSYLLSGTPQTAYNYEVGVGQTGYVDNMKIGLIYVSDYGYAASNDYWTTTMFTYNGATGNNWMYLGLTEWTISHTLDLSGRAFYIFSTGLVSNLNVNLSYAVRPSFYLESSTSYVSGSGTADDPIRIS